MSHGGAILPGTDLSGHARHLLRLRSAFIEQGSAAGRGPEAGGPAPRPRGVVARSWQRALGLGLDPDGSNARAAVPADEVRRRRRESPLGVVIDELTQVIGAVADASHMIFVVTDADGVILWREGTAAVRRRADVLGFAEGAAWTEATVGTNAIGTALAERAPVQLFAAEHFEQAQLPWYCTAAPVHDPRTGRLLGIIDVSGPALTLHPAVEALVDTARRLAEARLWRHHEQQLERVRLAGAPLVARAGGPALLVDDHGWVAHSSGIVVGNRIAAPAQDQPLTVPGLGLCLPERLSSGWLVRPASAGAPSRSTFLDACLDLSQRTSREPVLEVSAGTGGWRRPLTNRHAEILVLLLAAGPAGLTAGSLSRALFGDAEHVVTVRAEVSRLRRSLGALVDTRPYRLAPAVRMGVDWGPAGTPADCRFLKTSSSPGVRHLALSAR